MKKPGYKITNKCLSFFLITILGSALLIPVKVYSQVDPITAAAIAAAITWASQSGLFNCAPHLQACGGLKRCNATIAVLNLAKNGNDDSVGALKDYILKSDNQRHCVRSIMGQPFINTVLNRGNPPPENPDKATEDTGEKIPALVLSKNPNFSGTNWKITPNQDEGFYRIQNLGNSPYKNWYLDIDDNGGVILEKDASGSGTKWRITEQGGNSKIQNMCTCKYVEWYLDTGGI